MVKIIKIKQKKLTLKRSYNSPNFTGKSVLVTDPWEYAELWLRRKNNTQAQFYWQQAKHFYEATVQLPITSAPLTAYYCFLNATKTLLLVKGVQFEDMHGVSGYSKQYKKKNIQTSSSEFKREVNSKTHLLNEIVIIKKSGILPALCNCLEDDIVNLDGKIEYDLKVLLRNLVYIHRTYCLTYLSHANEELFIPLDDEFFVKKEKSNEIWFSAEVDEKYATKSTLNKLSKNFERDINFHDKFVVRLKKKTKWKNNATLETIKFLNYYKRVRKNVQYIAGVDSRWYIKRVDHVESIPMSSLTITFAVMHRLSELSRYEPVTLFKHLNSQQNWLLAEFIRSAPYQFIHQIASEITGEEFLVPRSGNL